MEGTTPIPQTLTAPQVVELGIFDVDASHADVLLDDVVILPYALDATGAQELYDLVLEPTDAASVPVEDLTTLLGEFITLPTDNAVDGADYDQPFLLDGLTWNDINALTDYERFELHVELADGGNWFNIGDFTFFANDNFTADQNITYGGNTFGAEITVDELTNGEINFDGSNTGWDGARIRMYGVKARKTVVSPEVVNLTEQLLNLGRSYSTYVTDDLATTQFDTVGNDIDLSGTNTAQDDQSNGLITQSGSIFGLDAGYRYKLTANFSGEDVGQNASIIAEWQFRDANIGTFYGTKGSHHVTATDATTINQSANIPAVAFIDVPTNSINVQVEVTEAEASWDEFNVGSHIVIEVVGII